MARISAVDVVLIAVGVPSALSASDVTGRPAVASVPAVVNTPFPPIFATLLLLASTDVPALSCVAVGPAIAVVLSAVDVGYG